MNVVVGGFIRGQALIALIVGVVTGIAMAVIGVPFAGMIGVIAGVTNIIPYVGPIVGGFVAAVVALFVDPWLAVWAILAFVAIQQLESMFLSPRIMSDQVGIHPVLVIVVLLAGASLGGLLGMLLAVPVAGVIRVTWDFFREKAGWIDPVPPQEPEPPPEEDASESISVGSA
jgi:predicted PurR-regulated permease PerM